jgi:hypothetical protein
LKPSLSDRQRERGLVARLLVVVVGGGVRQGRDLAAAHGDGRARIERRLRRRLARALVDRSLVHR